MFQVSFQRFELLELRGDDGVQTYHAREVATRRPVQVHVLPDPRLPATIRLLTRFALLPEAERRRVIDRGIFDGRPYVVTDRLAGFASFREWLELKSAPSPDEQFAQLFEGEPERVPQYEAADVESGDMAESFAPAGDPPRRGVSVLAIAVGAVAALLFLGLMAAALAFRPHWF
jgi:hypothetical protein